jgi:hypothetical protein
VWRRRTGRLKDTAMERLEQQQDPLGETTQCMVDFRSRLWQPQEEDKGGRLVAIIFVGVLAVAGIVGFGLL